MNKVIARKSNRERRALKTKGKLVGTFERPRISVFRSLKYVYAQIIDDTSRKVLVDVSSETKGIHKGAKKVVAAFELGKLLAKKAIDKKIERVVFDRKGYRYHGRIKSLADGAREGGLKF